MIVQILNRSEVERGIVEAAQDDAEKAEIVGNESLSNVAVARVVKAEARWNVDIAKLIADSAQNGGVGRKLFAAVEFLPFYERLRLYHVYDEAFARVMQERCELAEEERISALAAVIRCKFCDNTDPRGEQHSHLKHEFTCTHGREIAMPEECVTDHGEVE